MDYQPIENYGIIGDLHTVALVGINGSIDFMCYPEFDSPSIFAALLDKTKGGYFQITCRGTGIRNKQVYLPDTNILLTRFLLPEGVGEVIDFMPLSQQCNRNVLVRRVKSVRGSNHFIMHCKPRFDYARSGSKVIHQKNALLFLQDNSELGLKLVSQAKLSIKKGDGYAEFTLNEGETVDFLLCPASEEYPVDTLGEAVTKFQFDTMHYWRNWLSNTQYRGRWQEVVNRSALLLKLMTAKKYGSIVASPTFGLPEKIGGKQNWDYRYMWMRDAAFTLYALIRLGFTREAGEFINWLENYCPDVKRPGHLGLMYSITGKKQLDEQILEHLDGYKHSRPVRIGNAAYKQLQLDIYGELIDSIYLYNKYGEAISFDLWQQLTGQIDWLCDNWNQPDEGIWEVREGRKEFLYSRLMIWVAFDRMIRIARNRSFPISSRWFVERDKIHGMIFTEFWDEKRKTFVNYRRGNQVDAALFLMPLTRFIGAKDPRWLSTLKRIEEELVADSLVYRYRFSEEKEGNAAPFQEGTFSLCSFWYVECLSRSGELEKARYTFEKVLGYANHLGLYSEQLGLQGEHLGNFPQAFTHLGLISAAYNLDRNLNDARNKQT